MAHIKLKNNKFLSELNGEITVLYAARDLHTGDIDVGLRIKGGLYYLSFQHRTYSELYDYARWKLMIGQGTGNTNPHAHFSVYTRKTASNPRNMGLMSNDERRLIAIINSNGIHFKNMVSTYG